jgi:hypothetical protein
MVVPVEVADVVSHSLLSVQLTPGLSAELGTEELVTGVV